MEARTNLPNSSPILTFMVIVATGLVLMTMGKYFLLDTREAKAEVDPRSEKLVGRWEQGMDERIIDMDLDEDGSCTYALRESDRLLIHGTWKIEAGRLVLHIKMVNGGSNFREGEDVTLGPILNVDSRTLILGSEENKTIFRKRRGAAD